MKTGFLLKILPVERRHDINAWASAETGLTQVLNMLCSNAFITAFLRTDSIPSRSAAAAAMVS
jgi:hypothetical protein